MPKLLWVALPVLVAVALLALQALLRRQAPSRQALNIWSSLLLVAYVSTTAGLGIFWVANQQLPVFDWHYLFGYTTVLLVALHLSFNLRIAWRFLTLQRQSGDAPAGARSGAGTGPGRRRLLGAVGVLFATGMAFALGLRHGRSELRVQWPVAGGSAGVATLPETSAAAQALVERYHAFSSHTRAGMLLRAPGVDWGDPPPPFKTYPGVPRVTLPPVGAGEAPFGLASLGSVLWHTAGVSDARGPVKLRTSPSSGALFSTELYVAARAVDGLAPGLWHYDASTHALERLAAASPADAALGAPFEPALQGAAAVIVATAVLRRTGHKYGDRSYRYVLADLGHALENLRQATGAVGAQARLVARFDESRAAATVGVDEAAEGVLALVALTPAAAQGETPAISEPRRVAADDVQWLVPPAPAAQALPLGVTSSMHLATSLRTATSQGAAPPASASQSPVGAPPPGSFRLPRAGPRRGNVLGTLAVRRSVRRYAATPLTLQTLAGVLAGMTTASGTPLLSDAVRISLVVNAVTGMPPGAYRYQSESHALLPRRANTDLRAAAQAAALDQDVIGGAAVVFVLGIDRAAFAADPSGPARGFRHAFIEAGLVGERIYIEAGARGLGACAVGAFYDNEAAALVGADPLHEWIVHFAALGVPSV